MDREAEKELVLLFAGIAVVLFLLYGAGAGSMTGFLTFERDVTVSIEEQGVAEISSFYFERFITIGESIMVNAELANRGSVPLEGTYEVEVYDANNSLVTTYPGPSETVQPGSFLGREFRHTPHETGTYTLRMRAHMGGTNLQTSRSLIVMDEPQPDMDPDPIIRRRTIIRYIRPPPPPEPEPLERGWDIDAVDEVELVQGGSTTIPIRIHNTDEATLRNIQMGITSSQDLSVEYAPSILFMIAPSETRNFMLTLSVDEEVMEDQQLSWNVFENELSASGNVDIRVVPELTAGQLQAQIDRLQRMIDDLEQELDEEEAAGFDVSEAQEHMDEAVVLIDQMQQHLDNEEFTEAEALVDDTRRLIASAYQTLFRQHSEQLVVRAPLVRPLYLLLLAATAVAVLLVGTYYYLRERHRRRPKLLRRMDEE